jgi:hypothetical protein
MWILIITMWSTIPGANTSNGSINAKFPDNESCLRAKEQIVKSIKIDNYRVTASCIFRG